MARHLERSAAGAAATGVSPEAAYHRGGARQAVRRLVVLRCGILLLLLGLRAAASEPPPGLLGEWILAGTINLDSRLVTPAVDDLHLDLRRDVVIATSKGNHQAMYCSWLVDAQGIGLDLIERNGSVQHVPLLIRSDSMVVRFGEVRDCMLLKRTDGKPPGLPPSPWPEARTAPSSAPPDPKAPAGGDFTAHAQQLQLNRTLDFPDSGPGPVSGSESAHLTVILRPTIKAVIVSARGASVAEAITDNGEDLRPPSIDAFADPDSAFNRIGRDGDIVIQLPLRMPSSGAKELAHVRATVVVSCETATRAPFDLPLPRTLIGKRQLIADTGLGLTITGITAEQVNVSVDAGLARLIKECQFLDETGRTIDIVGSSSTGGDKTVEQSFNVMMPEQGAIRIRLYGTLVDVAVPIVLAHVALVLPPPADPLRKF